jgi:hypothetical protein
MLTRRKLSLVLSALGVALCLMGCPSADVVSESKCDAARRCATGVEEVCGEDGKTYACNALARCEGVIVDPSGQACMIDSPDMGDTPDMPDEPDMCPERCPSVCPDGYQNSLDENGCTTCACEPVDCAPVACDLFCAEGFKVGPDGCDVCECNNVGPICTYQPCEPGTRSECGADRDGDGCDDCFCTPIDCPAEEPPDCDGPGEVLVCEESDEGCQKCWCDVINCPPIDTPEELSCDANQRVECVPGDVCGTSCWCEDLMCPPLQDIDCDDGEPVRRVDDNGCSYMFCFTGICPDIACPEDVCPFGTERDENGCDTCESAVVQECQDDEQCGLYEACVFDLSDPMSCCPPLISCDDIFPACVGECQPLTPCEQGQLCGTGQACDEMERDDCCPLGALCDTDIPSCPLLCLDQAP